MSWKALFLKPLLRGAENLRANRARRRRRALKSTKASAAVWLLREGAAQHGLPEYLD